MSHTNAQDDDGFGGAEIFKLRRHTEAFPLVLQLVLDYDWRMDMNEFNSSVIRSEDNETVTFDVRPFGDRQGEAADCYLQGRVQELEMGVASLGSRTIVIQCDDFAVLPQSVDRWLTVLNNQGVPTDLRGGQLTPAPLPAPGRTPQG